MPFFLKVLIYSFLTFAFTCVQQVPEDQQVTWITIILCLWAFVWGISLSPSHEKLSKRHFLIALLIHIVFFITPALWEDDYFRYSWDGRAARMGQHPYAEAPLDVMEREMVPQYANSINYPHLRTLYPPLPEAVFAVTEWIDADGIYGWWFFIAVLDLVLLLKCFRIAEGSEWKFSLLALNPVYLKEGLNSGHLDIIAAVLCIFLFAEQKRMIRQTILAGLLTSIRPWFGAILLWRWRHWRWLGSTTFVVLAVLPWVILLNLPGCPPLEEALSSWKEFISQWLFNPLFYEGLSFVKDDSRRRLVAWIIGFGGIAALYMVGRRDSMLWTLGVFWWLCWQPTVNVWYIMPLIVAWAGIYVVQGRRLYACVAVGASAAFPFAYIHYITYNWTWVYIGAEILLFCLGYLVAQFFLNKKLKLTTVDTVV